MMHFCFIIPLLNHSSHSVFKSHWLNFLSHGVTISWTHNFKLSLHNVFQHHQLLLGCHNREKRKLMKKYFSISLNLKFELRKKITYLQNVYSFRWIIVHAFAFQFLFIKLEVICQRLRNLRRRKFLKKLWKIYFTSFHTLLAVFMNDMSYKVPKYVMSLSTD